MAKSLTHIDVSCSRLSAYSDCPRNASIGLIGTEIRSRYELAMDMNSIGAAMGRIEHTLAEELLKWKQNFGELDSDAMEAALEKCQPKLEKEIKKGILWDKTTPHEQTAFAQLRAMARALLPVLDLTEPLLIEKELQQLVNPLADEDPEALPVLLTGHVDCFDKFSILVDHKTGARSPKPFAQIGGYLALLAYEGHEPRGAKINFIKRLGIKSVDQTTCRTIVLPMDVCMDAAWTAIREIQRHTMRWLRTGEPSSFPANPMSQRCTPKYCPAYDTGYCKLGGCGAEPDEED